MSEQVDDDGEARMAASRAEAEAFLAERQAAFDEEVAAIARVRAGLTELEKQMPGTILRNPAERGRLQQMHADTVASLTKAESDRDYAWTRLVALRGAMDNAQASQEALLAERRRQRTGEQES